MKLGKLTLRKLRAGEAARAGDYARAKDLCRAEPTLIGFTFGVEISRHNLCNYYRIVAKKGATK